MNPSPTPSLPLPKGEAKTHCDYCGSLKPGVVMGACKDCFPHTGLDRLPGSPSPVTAEGPTEKTEIRHYEISDRIDGPELFGPGFNRLPLSNLYPSLVRTVAEVAFKAGQEAGRKGK